MRPGTDTKVTFGQRAADAVSRTIGSWIFVNTQTVLIIVYMLVNTYTGYVFDPPPFIGLNLIFSIQAAYTGPIVMIAAARGERLQRMALEGLLSLAEAQIVHLEKVERRDAAAVAERAEIIRLLTLILERMENDDRSARREKDADR